jgi:cytochrome c553
MRKLAFGALLLAAAWAHAAEVDGKTKANVACAACHGPMGMAMQPSVPNLAGQSAIYLIDQLKNFRSGKRQHEVMSVIAKPLTDAEIDSVSNWYSSLQVRVEAP